MALDWSDLGVCNGFGSGRGIGFTRRNEVHGELEEGLEFDVTRMAYLALT